MAEGVLRLKRGRERARLHPWIFKGDVADVVATEPGEPVTVVDASARWVGRGDYNPRPALCCRVLTRVDEPIDRSFLERRLATALAHRGTIGDRAAARLVWSEADFLPGLVVDRYGAVLVLQCSTLGMARRRPEIVAALRVVVGDHAVFSADEAAPARLEGFEPVRGWLEVTGPASVVVEEGRARFEVTFGTGHKTGLYLDQAENRALAGSLAAGRSVLDAFSYAGGFTVQMLLGGARRAVAIESSPEAAAHASANLALNGVAERTEVVTANAFDELRRLERERARFGLIVLDPPPFARGRDVLDAARRGYKEINLRAMRLLEPGGYLLTFSCSHHVSADLLEEICREAAADSGMMLRVARELGQGRDHPVLLTVPETRYLHGLLLEAV